MNPVNPVRGGVDSGQGHAAPSAPAMIGQAAGAAVLGWAGMVAALAQGHQRPRARISDSFLYRGEDTLLNRAAWIAGLGIAVKTATIFPGNPARGLERVNGGLSLYDDLSGVLEAVIDFHLVTRWKTAADSLLAATRLARPESRAVLIVGAGFVADALAEGYRALFPQARLSVWNRSAAGAAALAAAHPGMAVAPDLEAAVRGADIISCATGARAPIIRGEWLRPGQHLDLIGAFRADMREADDTALRRARIFVDARETTLAHIGEICIPLAEGVIGESDILGDFYDLPEVAGPDGSFARRRDDEITLFKNGGGAHLDLMAARYILERWQAVGAGAA